MESLLENVYLPLPKNPAAFNCSNLPIPISQTTSSFQGSTYHSKKQPPKNCDVQQKPLLLFQTWDLNSELGGTAICNKSPQPQKLISWDRKCRLPVQVPNSALEDNKRPAF
jgi:hypothetical protein